MTPALTMPKGPPGNVVSINPAQNKQYVQGKQNNQQLQKQRKDSGSGKRLMVDNQAVAKKAQANLVPNPIAALQLQANGRYNKGGRSFGGQGGSEVPLPPPLYPAAPKPSPLNPEMMDKVGVYTRSCQYISSNYGVHVERSHQSAFHVDRYIDKYKAALTVNPDIVHREGPGRFPEELSSTTFKKVRKPHLAIKAVKRVLDSLHEDDEKEEEGAEGAKRKKTKVDDDDDDDASPTKDPHPLEEEEMDEADEELDMGTDYMSNYFDNGEGYMDSDHEGDEDGSVY